MFQFGHFLMCMVLALLEPGENLELWQQLKDFRTNFVGCGARLVNFNLTRFASERKGLRSHEKEFEEFSVIVRELEVIDLPLGGIDHSPILLDTGVQNGQKEVLDLKRSGSLILVSRV